MKILHSPFAMLAVLLVVTLASFFLFETHTTPMIVGLGVVAFAGLKIALIIAGFMEVRLRHMPVGPALAVWITAVLVIVGGGFAFG